MEPPIREAPKDSDPEPILDGQLHLLIGDLREDVARYRRREAVWMSIAAHVAGFLALILVPKWLPQPIVVVPVPQKEDATNIEFPLSPSPKIKAPEMASNQISQQKQAVLPSREDLRRLAEAAHPPGRETPPPQPAPQQAMQTPQPPPQQQTQESKPLERTTDTAKLEMPPTPKQNPFSMSSPGSSVDQAIHSAANRAGSDVGGAGGHTAGIRPKIDQMGDFQVLTDTLGVDFGPYWARLRRTVQDHWDPLIPEVAKPPVMKQGRVVIEFAILKNGGITGMKLISSSGDVALDRAAIGALTYADPLPVLPTGFTGDFVLVRAAFYYNPDRKEFE